MPKKMQTGGTFIGPFATASGQATPRQNIVFGSRGAGPTINLPGQDPISPGQGRTVQPFNQTAETEESRLRRQQQQQEQRFQQEFKRLQDEIDTQIANPGTETTEADFNTSIEKNNIENITSEDFKNMSPALQYSIANYDKDKAIPKFFTDIFGDTRTGKEGLLGEFANKTAGIKGLGLAFGIPLSGGSKDGLSGLDRITVGLSNLLNPTPTGALQTDPGGQFRSTGPIQDMTQPLTSTPPRTGAFQTDTGGQFRNILPQGSTGAGAPNVFSDPLELRKAEVFKTLGYVNFVNRETDAKQSFSSADHSAVGVTVADEVELIAKTGESIDKGKQLIDTFVKNGLDKDDIEIAIDPQADTSGLAPSLGFDPGAALGFGPGRG